jgi:hypothetical protein
VSTGNCAGGTAPAPFTAAASGFLLPHEVHGFLELAEELLQVLIEHDDLVTFEITLSVLLALHDIEKEITVTVFLYIEKIGPLADCGLGGKYLAAYTHQILSFSRSVLRYYRKEGRYATWPDTARASAPIRVIRTTAAVSRGNLRQLGGEVKKSRFHATL